MKYFSPTPASKFCWICAGRERAVVDGDHAHHAFPLAVGRGLVAEHQREGVVPVGETAAALRVGVARVHAVHVEAAAFDRAVGQHDVLQRRLRVHVGRVGQQHRVAVGAGLVAARVAFVLVHALRQREVARVDAGRVADDVRVFLRDVGVVDPRLDREFTGRLDEVGELLRRRRGALGLAAHLDVDAPAADPGDVAGHREVQRRLADRWCHRRWCPCRS